MPAPSRLLISQLKLSISYQSTNGITKEMVQATWSGDRDIDNRPSSNGLEVWQVQWQQMYICPPQQNMSPNRRMALQHWNWWGITGHCARHNWSLEVTVFPSSSNKLPT
jgi:hypothetical protein